MQIGILSRGQQLYSTQSLIEAGRGRGHKMVVLDHLYCHLVVDTNGFDLLYNGLSLRSLDAVIPRIGASVTAEGAAVIRHFEAMKIFSLISSASLLGSRDKLFSLQKLASRGIPVPKTVVAARPEEIPPALELLGGTPVIIKLLESTHGVGVILAPDISTAITLGETLYKLGQRIILQEYIAESEGADYRAFVVGGKIVATMKRQAKEGEFRSNLHRGAQGSVVSLTAEEELLVRKTATVMQLEVAGIDLIRSNRGPLIIEVNASPGLEGIETITKVDIAHEIILNLERKLHRLREKRKI